MSGIFGVLNRQGQAVDAVHLTAMHETFAQWLDEDRGRWCEGHVGIGHTMRRNAPESHIEALPRCEGEPGTRLVITCHSRLDNRRQLAETLDFGHPLSEIADSELILSAYRKWGYNCPQHLLGDFAFAIWDEGSNRLFCARDHMGIRPLFYRKLDGQFLFANCIEPLIADCFPRPRLKDETVASFLRNGENYSPSETFFDDVFQLPPASVLIADQSGVNTRSYWSLSDVPPIELASVDDYTQMLRELLADAVTARLRSEYPLGAHLTGGLDSSGIVACAANSGGDPSMSLHTFTWMHEPTSDEERESPEWSMAREIAETYGLPHWYTEFSSDDVLGLLGNHDIALGDTVDVWAEKSLARQAAGRGVRTMLSGWGGDQLISHYGNDVYAERALRGEVLPAIRELLRPAKVAGRSPLAYPKYIYDYMLRPLFRAYWPPFGSPYAESRLSYLDYASPEMRQRSEDGLKLMFYKGVELRKQQYCTGQLAHAYNRASSWAISGQQLGMDYAYPLLDKRIVEMAVAVPIWLYRRNGVPRFLFKLALSAFEPTEFWWRNQKHEPLRVRRTLETNIRALESWAKQRQGAEQSGRFIEEQRLIQDISKLKIGDMSDTTGTWLKVLSMKRAILVVGLERYS